MAETPFICYGQTQTTYNSAIDNPTPNSNGLVGEVTSLPFTVPNNKVLVLESIGIEAYGNISGCQAMFPWVGDAPATNPKGLMTVLSDNDSNEISGAKFHIPSGKKLNIRIMTTENPGSVCGWYLSGRLVDA
jgi:hypothetical protein